MPEQASKLFSWLNVWRPDELRGRLANIFIAPAAGASMQCVQSAECVPGRGLNGDRYASARGHWTKTDAAELTLITLEDLRRAERRVAGFAHGWHRRNLVVTGIPLAAYRRHQVRVGDVLCEFHRLRPPCGYLDRIVQPGAAKALGKGAGIALRVLEAGVIRVGDPVEVLQPERR